MTNGAAALFMRTAYQTAATYFGDTPLDALSSLPPQEPSVAATAGGVPASDETEPVSTDYGIFGLLDENVSFADLLSSAG